MLILYVEFVRYEKKCDNLLDDQILGLAKILIKLSLFLISIKKKFKLIISKQSLKNQRFRAFLTLFYFG